MSRRTSVNQRQTFSAADNFLIRTVRLVNGREYTHRCALDAYREIAWFIEDHSAEGVTTTLLWQELTTVSCTQAAVALAFMKERGCLEVRHRRCYPASGIFFEDAMIEYYALKEGLNRKNE